MMTSFRKRFWLAFGAMATAALIATEAQAFLSCVPYARMRAGVEVAGNAHLWWNNSQGQYERGAKPANDAVLVFKASGKMRRGHVSVVSTVIDSRSILVDHANWGGPGLRKGTIQEQVLVTDISPKNDWTEVRVWNEAIQDFGSKTYPTYGFIYSPGQTPKTMKASAQADWSNNRFINKDVAMP
jgi:surface antigen